MLIFASNYSGKELFVVLFAYIIVLIVSLSLHEFAHAYVAYKNGDNTAKLAGRLTVNPIRHMDPIGFVCCVCFGFGWAKPVPVNPLKFRNIKKGMALVSIAGVIVNLTLAFIFCAFYLLCAKYLPLTNYFQIFIYVLCYFMFVLNLCFFIFNLLPIYPLDGFNLISSITKPNAFVNFMRVYGNFILIAVILLFSNVIGWLINAVGMPIKLFWQLFI